MCIYCCTLIVVADPGLRMRLGKAMLGPRFSRKLNEGGNGTKSHEILDALRSKEFSFSSFLKLLFEESLPGQIDKDPAW